MAQPSQRLNHLVRKGLRNGRRTSASRGSGGRAPRLRLPKVALVLFLLLVGGVLFFNYGRDRVVRIHDGDTISVFTRGGGFERIRLYGVDCPEYGQPGGKEASDFTDELAFMQEVRVTPINRDQYGRTVALVHLPDGRLLNEELVRGGHAWVYRAYCKEPWCPSWIRLEQQARARQSGLWIQKKPQAPWEWRRHNPRK